MGPYISPATWATSPAKIATIPLPSDAIANVRGSSASGISMAWQSSMECRNKICGDIPTSFPMLSYHPAFKGREQ